jgi:hypothetical protein
MPNLEKQYIGDGVYADFDGYTVTLTTENGTGITNTIYLEPEVLQELEGYVNRLRKQKVAAGRATRK